jgi:energy-coupling factor transport system ATP-binding protein
MLRDLNMEAKAGDYPRDLSEGERQRAAIAAMLVSDPAVILLDEPTRGLDYRNKSLLARFLQRKRAEGKAVIMATHDVELVATCADRVVLMGEGEVIIDGPTREVLSESTIFSTQVNKLFRGTSWLTVEDAIEGMGLGAEGEAEVR